jgi:ETFB lysine methyltransferase
LPVDPVPPARPFPYRFRDFHCQFVQPDDPEAVLNAVSSNDYQRDEFLPYWTDHWPSCEALIGYLLDAPTGSAGCAIELGSGLGVAAAILGHKFPRIIATDISFSACSFALRNLDRAHGMPLAVCCDWRTPCFVQCADLVFASDILYEKRWKRPVLDFLDSVLKPTGSAYIADPRRPYWEKFLSRAVERGFQVDLVHSQIVNEGKTRVEIVRIKKAPRI